VTDDSGHQPVLLRETLAGLAIRENACYVDGTYGRGGHSAGILAQLGDQGRLLSLDKDPEAVAHARERFGADPRFSIEHGGFEELSAHVEPWLAGHPLAGVLLDIGVSSPQLDSAERGFSFAKDGPLDMRMNIQQGLTAAEWLADVSQAELTRVLAKYGEEPRARQLAAVIVRERENNPITTTRQLAELIEHHSPKRPQRLHPATRVFQALRIRINAELESLATALEQSLELLAPGGRLCVISFHSLEDRIVKRFIAKQSRVDPVYAGLPKIPPEAQPRLAKIGRLVRPSKEEEAANPRSRSARLRVAEKLEGATS
jgi:16S rRNA (cytosine1402-N4)-methyltransferase